MRTQLAVMLCIAISGACVTRGSLHPFPSKPGRTAMLEAADLFHDLVTQCHGDDVSPWREAWAMNVRVRGVAGQYRVNRDLRVGFRPDGYSMRIESVPLSGDRSFVVLVTSAPKAPPPSLLLQNGTRVVRTDRAATLLDRLLGVPLTPAGIQALLRGCYFHQPENDIVGSGTPTLYDPDWMSMPFGRNGRAFYRRASAGKPWQPVTLLYPGKGLEPAWRLDYHDIREHIPYTLVVTGIEAKNVRLEITQSNVLSASLPNELFTEQPLSNSQLVSLDDIDLAALFAQ